MKIEKKVFEAARKHYSNLPYHNYEHALNVYKESRKIISNYQGRVDELAVYHAALFHDAAYHLDHRKLRFKTKEHLSAFIAGEELAVLDYKKKHVQKVMKIILATIMTNKPKTIEEKIVRAADLAGMKGSYENFLVTNKKLAKEHKILTGKTLTKQEKKDFANQIIRYYLSENIKLTKKYYTSKGESLWHTRVRSNLEHFLETN